MWSILVSTHRYEGINFVDDEVQLGNNFIRCLEIFQLPCSEHSIVVRSRPAIETSPLYGFHTMEPEVVVRNRARASCFVRMCMEISFAYTRAHRRVKHCTCVCKLIAYASTRINNYETNGVPYARTHARTHPRTHAHAHTHTQVSPKLYIGLVCGPSSPAPMHRCCI